MSGLAHVAAFLGGAAVVVAVVLSAVKTVVLPHGRGARLTGVLFVGVRRLIELHERLPAAARRRHRAMSLYAPVSLVLLPFVWLSGTMLGLTAMFWGLGTHPLRAAFKLAGSSMLTLGFADVSDLPREVLSFLSAGLVIAVLGLLLVTYLPSIYAAYSARETAVTSLDVVAGAPPRVSALLVRHHRIGGVDRLDEVWRTWRDWFTSAAESHTALPAVVLFRSGDPERSWLRAAETVLDAAGMQLAIGEERNAEAALCIRAGYVALRAIAEFYRFEVTTDPGPDDPITVGRADFDAVVATLEAAGVPLPADRDQAWRDWAGWRVNYDEVVRQLAELTATELTPPS